MTLGAVLQKSVAEVHIFLIERDKEPFIRLNRLGNNLALFSFTISMMIFTAYRPPLCNTPCVRPEHPLATEHNSYTVSLNRFCLAIPTQSQIMSRS